MLVEEIPPSSSEPQDSRLTRIQYAPQMQPWQAKNLKARYWKIYPTETPDTNANLARMARPYSALRERVWDMAIEQFVAPHHGQHSIQSHDTW